MLIPFKNTFKFDFNEYLLKSILYMNGRWKCAELQKLLEILQPFEMKYAITESELPGCIFYSDIRLWHVSVLKYLQRTSYCLLLRGTHGVSFGEQILSYDQNSLWFSDAVWRHITWSSLVKVTTCCISVANHYLNQYWLNVSEILWHSLHSTFAR